MWVLKVRTKDNALCWVRRPRKVCWSLLHRTELAGMGWGPANLVEGGQWSPLGGDCRPSSLSARLLATACLGRMGRTEKPDTGPPRDSRPLRRTGHTPSSWPLQGLLLSLQSHRQLPLYCGDQTPADRSCTSSPLALREDPGVTASAAFSFPNLEESF